MKLRPKAQGDALLVVLAIVKLKSARDLLIRAGCPLASDATRRALKSADGARRHMHRRPLAR